MSFGESLFKHADCELSVASDEYSIMRSRFFKTKYHMLESGMADTVDKILAAEHHDVIVPMGDVSASFLSKNKKSIEQRFGVHCAVPEYSCLSLVEDKSRFMDFCEKHGVPHPKTVRLSADTLAAAARQTGFPALIKPDFSVGAKGITRVDSIEELEGRFPQVSAAHGDCSLQEFIDNPDYYFNVMLYRDGTGSMKNYAITKIVRMYPVKAGSSSCCHTIENGELLDICRNVLDKLNWVGMADFDVLQRPDTGEYKIIEINPRVPASLRAAYISGVNFPELIVRDVMGNPPGSYMYRPGMTLRYLGIDLMWLAKSPKRLRKLFSWLNFFGRNVYYQDIILSDPSTWYSWLVEGLTKIKKRNKAVSPKKRVDLIYNR